MKSVITVLKEQIDNFYLIMRLSLYELKNKNTSNYLGMAWEIINTSIQSLIYWFVFGTLRERAPVEVYGMYILFCLWLIAGCLLWSFSVTCLISVSVYIDLLLLSYFHTNL